MPAAADAPLRVAAYCRVSTDKEDQRNSLAAQREFFIRYIEGRPGWDLVGVFADEGLSGTSTRRRPRFSEMLRRAMAGEIDLILTKEVSRFARNTVDTLQLTRQLKARGVGVVFLNDGLDTRDNDGEFRLTIMASVAQEESRKISERTRWGQLQAMRRGVAFGNNSIYGYTLRGGRLTVEPEQARVVRRVYREFLAGHKGAHTIARELTQAGIPPPLRSAGPWSATMVGRILRNEKYCGDLLQKKYRTIDHLSHRKVLNEGAEEQFCIRDHHEAIVSREDFQAVQAELSRRAGLPAEQKRFSARYWYSGKIRCGACGKGFTLKRTRRASGAEYTRFVCRGRLDGAGGCRMRAVRGEVILAVARRVVRQLALDGPAIIDRLLRELKGLHAGGGSGGASGERLRQALRRQLDRKDRAQEAYLDGELSREDMRRLVARCEAEITRLQAELEKPAAHGRDVHQEEQRFREIRQLLERELAGGDTVLDELIQSITVLEDCFLVEVAGLPVRFRVYAGGIGTGGNQPIQATACTGEPPQGGADLTGRERAVKTTREMRGLNKP